MCVSGFILAQMFTDVVLNLSIWLVNVWCLQTRGSDMHGVQQISSMSPNFEVRKLHFKHLPLSLTSLTQIKRPTQSWLNLKPAFLIYLPFSRAAKVKNQRVDLCKVTHHWLFIGTAPPPVGLETGCGNWPLVFGGVNRCVALYTVSFFQLWIMVAVTEHEHTHTHKNMLGCSLVIQAFLSVAP